MKTAYPYFEETLRQFQKDGVYKNERVLTTAQGSHIDTTQVKNVINMCANNYLGLSGDKRLVEAAKTGLEQWGYGLSSVRFICGTQQLHKELESTISSFLGMDDTILYSSCFDANGGLFETLLGEDCAIISDELNHASIIDGVRLCKARRFRYKNSNMAELESCLVGASDARIRLIATDGVFSMDGTIANLSAICDLAERYDALVMVDDSHAVGFVGEHGKGTPELCDVQERVDIITGTLGKALGGASGGYTAARQPIIDLLRQKSRPYLFSNTLAPAIAAASLEVFRILGESSDLLWRLKENTNYFRSAMRALGFDIIQSSHPIVAVMLYDAKRAAKAAERLLELGVYVTSFTYPVVPKEKARIRVQLSAAHSREDLERVVACFETVKAELL